MRHFGRWVLHYECPVRDHRGRDILGLYPTHGGEVAGAAAEGVEAASGGCEISGLYEGTSSESHIELEVLVLASRPWSPHEREIYCSRVRLF